MTERMCPECGSETDEWEMIKECTICGHCYLKKLSLKTKSGKLIKFGRLATIANRSWIKPHIGDESKFWADDCQMTFKLSDGQWILKANNSATNKTLIDGKTVTENVVLTNGMQVAVGKEAIGETPAKIKSPMQVILE